jgi:hypothetical protein
MNNDDYRYTYRRNGVAYSIYDGGCKIAEITGDVEKRLLVAREMVRALNARDKYLNRDKAGGKEVGR